MADFENVLPTETSDGVYEGRATFLMECDCGCGRDTVYYHDDGSGCWDQTVAVRGDDLGIPKVLEGVSSDELSAAFDSLFEFMSNLLESDIYLDTDSDPDSEPLH